MVPLQVSHQRALFSCGKAVMLQGIRGGVTHMSLEAGEVDVWDKQDGLCVQVGHHFESGDVTALVQKRDLHICNCEEKD